MTEANAAMAAGVDDLADAELLERFTSQGEEAAFAALVRRYGPLVLGVCRRILQHEQDAEDVFQAVFCVLARKAGTIRNRGAVGAWLHGVAYRIAQKARTGRRKLVTPTHLPDVSAPEDSPAWVWQELRPILDEEINRCPEKYRQAFVLCYLEGLSKEEAAARLGCPLGTLLSRLARARERLRARLLRRGLVLSAAGVAAALASQALADTVPPQLSSAAMQAAAASRGGPAEPGTLSPSVLALAEGFVRWQGRRRLVRSLAGILALAVGCLLGLVWLRWPEPVPPSRPDWEQLQGTWSVERVEAGGQVMPNPGMQLVFAGNVCTLFFEGGHFPPRIFVLDQGQTPREITLTQQGAPPWPGIYQLEKDSLILCVNSGGLERPREFNSGAGPNVFLYFLNRPAGPPNAPGPEPGRRS